MTFLKNPLYTGGTTNLKSEELLEDKECSSRTVMSSNSENVAQVIM
jgi:hypothetical protein